MYFNPIKLNDSTSSWNSTWAHLQSTKCRPIIAEWLIVGGCHNVDSAVGMSPADCLSWTKLSVSTLFVWPNGLTGLTLVVLSHEWISILLASFIVRNSITALTFVCKVHQFELLKTALTRLIPEPPLSMVKLEISNDDPEFSYGSRLKKLNIRRHYFRTATHIAIVSKLILVS